MSLTQPQLLRIMYHQLSEEARISEIGIYCLSIRSSLKYILTEVEDKPEKKIPMDMYKHTHVSPKNKILSSTGLLNLCLNLPQLYALT